MNIKGGSIILYASKISNYSRNMRYVEFIDIDLNKI